MRVYILTKIAENETDIEFRIVTKEKGLSDIITLPGQADFLGGNPYSLYGDHAVEYTGTGWKDFSLTVARANSGPL